MHWNRTAPALEPHYYRIGTAAVLAMELLHEEFQPGRNVIQMFPVIVIIAIPLALTCVAACVFAVIVAGIRKADRSRLTSDSVSRAEAIARRVVGGVRYHGESDAPTRFESSVSS